MQQKPFILLVEDNPDDVALLLRCLKKQGFAEDDIVVVQDGSEALDYLFGMGIYKGRDTSNLPQLVLLDVHLPKMSGLAFLAAVRQHQRFAFMPVVMLTSTDDASDVIQSYAYRANSCIRKPTSLTNYSDTIKRIVSYWLSLNQSPSYNQP